MGRGPPKDFPITPKGRNSPKIFMVIQNVVIWDTLSNKNVPQYAERT